MGRAEAVFDASIERLSSLGDHSLVSRIDSGTRSRYTMLETVREFAQERLEASGEAAAIRRRHADFVLAVAESANLTQETEEHGERRELASEELHDLRAALGWAADTDPSLGLALAVALELLGSSNDAPPALRARALRAYGGVVAIVGEDGPAARIFEESLAGFELLGDRRGGGHLLVRLAACALHTGEIERAQELTRESLTIAREVRDRRTETLALGLSGEIAYQAGEIGAALQLVRETVALAAAIGYVWQQARMLRRLADWALERRDFAEATRAARESLRLAHDTRDRVAGVFALARLAQVAAGTGRRERAGRLWGAVEAEGKRGAAAAWQSAFEVVYAFRQARGQVAVPELAGVDAEFDQGRLAGHALTFDQAIAEGLSESDAVDSRIRPSRGAATV
jgi:tetratricopeptide (TPR) repeat protein